MRSILFPTDAAVLAPSSAKPRDLRIDFFRGLALIFIFIDHVPGNSLAYLTMHSFGLSDAAEAFVLIAGFAAALAYANTLERDGLLAGARRIGARLRELYAAQLLLVAICGTMLGLAARWFENPLYFEHVNLTPFSHDPWGAIWRSLLLYYQLGYINILPLYIMLLAWFPVLWLMLRRNAASGLALSVAVWLSAGWGGMNLPSWPDVYGWYFNPFAWQLLFATGAFAAFKMRQGATLNRSPLLVGLADCLSQDRAVLPGLLELFIQMLHVDIQILRGVQDFPQHTQDMVPVFVSRVPADNGGRRGGNRFHGVTES